MTIRLVETVGIDTVTGLLRLTMGTEPSVRRACTALPAAT